MDVFKVRLNCIDHYQATPTRYDPCLRNDVRPDQVSKEPKIPVIRVFGSTETGQKVCAHIHGAFPYLFIEYQGSLIPDDVGAFIYRLHLSIDHALAVSYRQDVYGRDPPKYVARITIVKGIPFYGFHVGYRFYLKIYMMNPVVMTRLADLLHQGVIMKRKFQPYEAHLQYLLQFMTDYNLYGCGYIEVGKVSFRSPVPQVADGEEHSSPHIWHRQSIWPALITDDYSLPRVSHCSIEVDICVQDILNRRDIKERRLHHDFVERLNPLPPDLKLVHSMAGLWKDETKRRKRRLLQLSNPGSSPFPAEALVSMSADPRDSQPQGWLHEEEFREEIHQLIVNEGANDPTDVSFDSFAQPVPLEETVQTVLESVEDLYPSRLESSLRNSSQYIEENEMDPSSSIEVDEKGARGISGGMADEDNLFPDDSDEDMVREAELLERQALKQQKLHGRNGSKQPSVASKASARASAKPAGAASLDFSTVNGIVGVCASGLIQGKRPEIPITDELLEAAEEEGLVSDLPSPTVDQPHQVGQPASLKRTEHPTPVQQETKRPRGINGLRFVPPPERQSRMSRRALPSSAETEPHTLPSSQPLAAEETSQPPPSSQPRKSVLRNGAGNQTLSFAVVKDPHDPETVLRLSQKTSSQHSEGDIAKHVSFQSVIPSSSDDQLSSLSLIQDDSPDEAKISPWSGPTPPETVEPSTVDLESDWAGTDTARVYVIRHAPPTAEEVCDTMEEYGLPDVIYQDAFYSKEKDVPLRSREFAGRQFRLLGNTLPYLPEFDPDGRSPATYGLKGEAPDKGKMKLEYERRRQECSIKSWEIAQPPPTFDEVSSWWDGKQEREEAKKGGTANAAVTSPSSTPTARPYMSQIEGATPRNKHGFKYSQRQKSTSVQHEVQYMSTMSIEIHVNTRGKLVPNPEEDEVKCVFWSVKSDGSGVDGSQDASGVMSGLVVLSEEGTLAERIRNQISGELLEETSELDLMVRMVEIVRTHDPDILTGYEVHGSSWGYLIERARFKYDYNLCDEFSRMKSQSHGRHGKDADRWGFNTTSTIRVTGRHMINIWRAMRGELNLLQYTMENVVWHLLHRRIPHYSWQTLTEWYTNGRHRDLAKLLRYYQSRTRLDIEILEENELVSRTSEQARLLGVDFFSVFSRGSQFKVESIMFRIAKPENFMLVSPSRKQVGGQNALECLPLVMEPQSAFYTSPVLVLDFQSLYPSVMIAYNYCYSTFLGRIVDWRGTNKMGFAEYRRRRRFLELLQDHINIAPNGIMYTKAEIRKSLLAKMLTEILETRVMVKSGMKQDRDDKTLQQLLNNRQLALKLLANVTYGYTSASFSGRLPCSEIADSIVQTGRETLERSIAFIHSVERWGAEVVYGDTDSLFIHLKGRTKEQAFDIGDEIARAITDMNPRPIKLKFEKVYLPCVLLAKKRYVGYKFESRDQLVPEFDAKGIETVRRDGTPAEQKIEEKALRLLFETADLSQVKEYFQRQCGKIMRGDVSVQDFCFAREVKLGTYSTTSKGPPPAGALISTRRMLEDARAEPQYGERVPYVVVAGAPGARLVDRCVPPEDLLSVAGSHMRLDAGYYILKNIIPPLERIFNLVGAHVRGWYDEMPRVQRIRRLDPAGDDDHGPGVGPSAFGGGALARFWGAGAGAGAPKKKKVTLESYLHSASCAVCDARIRQTPKKPKRSRFGGYGGNSNNNINKSNVVICTRCTRDTARSLTGLYERLARERRRLDDVLRVCQSCAGLAPGEEVDCDSRDCPVFYTRVKQASRLRTEARIVEPAIRRLEDRAVRRVGPGRRVGRGGGGSGGGRKSALRELEW